MRTEIVIFVKTPFLPHFTRDINLNIVYDYDDWVFTSPDFDKVPRSLFLSPLSRPRHGSRTKLLFISHFTRVFCPSLSTSSLFTTPMYRVFGVSFVSTFLLSSTKSYRVQLSLPFLGDQFILVTRKGLYCLWNHSMRDRILLRFLFLIPKRSSLSSCRDQR